MGKLSIAQKGLVILGNLVLVDLDAQSRPLDATPIGPVHDGDPLSEDVVFHHLRRLLVAVVGIRRGQHHVLAGRCGKAELAMCMLADDLPLVVRKLNQC